MTGELGLAAATRFFRDVGDVLGSHLTVILNLAGVTFCDSSGLNTLLRLRRTAAWPKPGKHTPRRAHHPRPERRLQAEDA
ncbi:STAS domain-containing protein [Streptomyces sp. CCNWLW238]